MKIPLSWMNPWSWSSGAKRGLFTIGLFAVLLAWPIYIGGRLVYSETKGPFKNWMQVIDLENDGDLDVIVSHTRWEDVDISWAGIGQWINQGDGTFTLLRDYGTEPYPLKGFAAGAGDIDLDGDPDLLTQDFGIHLMVNEGGEQAGDPGEFRTTGGNYTHPIYNKGYRDMGGTISIGDLNGDGLVDAFVAGCCYGVFGQQAANSISLRPSVSWVWINGGRQDEFQTGHVLPIDSLEGRPIRETALGDLDGDGDLDIFAAVGQPTLGTTDSLVDLVLLNDGTGSLAVADQHLGNTDSTSVALGDVNGDGHLDALVGTSSGASLWINQIRAREGGMPDFVLADQAFDAVQTVGTRLQKGFSGVAGELLGLYLPYGSTRTTAVFLADLDDDGDLDILLARIFGAEIWWNDGQGKFNRSDIRFKYIEDTGIAVEDFDGDGYPDIFIGRNEDNYQVWWNDGHGEFSVKSQ